MGEKKKEKELHYPIDATLDVERESIDFAFFSFKSLR